MKRGAKVPEVQNSSLRENEGKTREKVAKAAGVSHDTIRKVKAIEAFKVLYNGQYKAI